MVRQFRPFKVVPQPSRLGLGQMCELFPFEFVLHWSWSACGGELYYGGAIHRTQNWLHSIGNTEVQATQNTELARFGEQAPRVLVSNFSRNPMETVFKCLTWLNHSQSQFDSYLRNLAGSTKQDSESLQSNELWCDIALQLKMTLTVKLHDIFQSNVNWIQLCRFFNPARWTSTESQKLRENDATYDSTYM